MVSTDPIADMLTRIRNALAVRKDDIILPHSTIKEAVANILKDKGYIEKVEIIRETDFPAMKLTFNNSVSISEISRISKPGRRVYAKVKDIPTVKQGRGVVIISTSKGVMDGAKAKENKLGGEIICQIY